jgi:hypothetical protein
MQGNVGACLASTPETMATFFSSDGGQNWRQLASGAITYEISGAGGFLAIAQQQNGSSFLFSGDFGSAWRECALPLPALGGPLFINNILTRSFTAQEFLLYGVANGSGIVSRLAFVTPLADCGEPLMSDGETPSANCKCCA